LLFSNSCGGLSDRGSDKELMQLKKQLLRPKVATGEQPVTETAAPAEDTVTPATEE
jgi:hypothetical protein